MYSVGLLAILGNGLTVGAVPNPEKVNYILIDYVSSSLQ